ncbi:hypothetical protein I5R65_15165 [Herbaspirillum sp. AP02]|uniref:hypothetical protein n=1 Tax=unclassified Herbaspirillum TaxID=2624150 RepID=UPI0015DA0982|nr:MULTISPECIES: hypothetical protein [unclassified Herbaspirillum]MBG7620806.1 hypothetical protein [Herbaspirillum sp. AP02]NZD68269.1 hypothetical protein [Herbaspirillum sp. AP21]
MHPRFEQFRHTELGKRLEYLLSGQEKYIEYRLCTRLGIPPVAAIVHDLLKLLPEISSNDTAKQFCGAVVAEIMREHGHTDLGKRGRVSGGLFQTGTLWSI